MFSSPVWARGYTPETPLFLFTGAYLSFLFKKIGLLITRRNIFILFFVFYYFLETFAHSCKGLKSSIDVSAKREIG
ncbi:hypothetical protein BREVNS_1009 [Brevinematales bacterium NS]|nr:hypothetical protein BREVNS_1009 [Brevinematales bacterium NS]